MAKVGGSGANNLVWHQLTPGFELNPTTLASSSITILADVSSVRMRRQAVVKNVVLAGHYSAAGNHRRLTSSTFGVLVL
jgi:hypothetical protein